MTVYHKCLEDIKDGELMILFYLLSDDDCTSEKVVLDTFWYLFNCFFNGTKTWSVDECRRVFFGRSKSVENNLLFRMFVLIKRCKNVVLKRKEETTLKGILSLS
jgi:hypothetical protein